jgi:hypothetical protein
MQVNHEHASNVEIAERSACSESVYSITTSPWDRLCKYSECHGTQTTDFACRVLMHAVSMFPRSCGTKRNNPIWKVAAQALQASSFTPGVKKKTVTDIFDIMYTV